MTICPAHSPDLCSSSELIQPTLHFLRMLASLKGPRSLELPCRADGRTASNSRSCRRTETPRLLANCPNGSTTSDYESPYPAEHPQPEHPQSYAELAELHRLSPTAWPSQRTKECLTDISSSEADPGPVTSNAKAFEQYSARFTKPRHHLNFETTLLAHAKLYVLADSTLLPSRPPSPSLPTSQSRVGVYHQRTHVLVFFSLQAAYCEHAGVSGMLLRWCGTCMRIP